MIDADALTNAREAKKLSQAELAKLVGCSQQLIAALENGTTQTTKFLPRIALALDVPSVALDSDWGGAATEPSGAILRPLMGVDRDFPIYASAEGGPGEIIRSADPVDWVPRPEPVARVKNAYGLYIVGESMLPEFEPGNIALVNPVLPIVGNTTCVLYAEMDGEARATIKRVLRTSQKDWHLRQWNPKKDFTLSRKEWGVCHRVIGKYYQQ
jgi:phage repressor protein C with HTH and peptisase S24 domain